MRLGESAKLRVAISLKTLDSTKDEGKELVEIRDAGSGAIGNETYLSCVRFELASLPVIPTGELMEAFSERAPGVFLWQINAEEVGEYPGRIWLYAQPELIMSHSEDLLLSETLMMQNAKFRVASILGLRLEFTKLLGVGGLALGGLLLADLLLAFLVIVVLQIRIWRS